MKEPVVVRLLAQNRLAKQRLSAAATPVDSEVRARATYTGREGKLYTFTIEAFDGGGKVGEGDHTRAIISTERLLAGAAARIK